MENLNETLEVDLSTVKKEYAEFKESTDTQTEQLKSQVTDLQETVQSMEFKMEVEHMYY